MKVCARDKGVGEDVVGERKDEGKTRQDKTT